MMKRLIAVTLMIAVLAACGDDEDSSPSYAGAGGTTGGFGGSSGAGATGGSSATGGSGGSTSVGTGGSGGSSGSGGGGGSTADGGMMMSEQQVCPATQPTNGATCMPGRGDCEFAANVCECSRNTETWVCWNPETDCPAEPPADEAACPIVGIECQYGRGRNRNECDCEDTGWACDGDEPDEEDGGV